VDNDEIANTNFYLFLEDYYDEFHEYNINYWDGSRTDKETLMLIIENYYSENEELSRTFRNSLAFFLSFHKRRVYTNDFNRVLRRRLECKCSSWGKEFKDPSNFYSMPFWNSSLECVLNSYLCGKCRLETVKFLRTKILEPDTQTIAEFSEFLKLHYKRWQSQWEEKDTVQHHLKVLNSYLEDDEELTVDMKQMMVDQLLEKKDAVFYINKFP
jgi:hypothetical protein